MEQQRSMGSVTKFGVLKTSLQATHNDVWTTVRQLDFVGLTVLWGTTVRSYSFFRALTVFSDSCPWPTDSCPTDSCPI